MISLVPTTDSLESPTSCRIQVRMHDSGAMMLVARRRRNRLLLLAAAAVFLFLLYQRALSPSAPGLGLGRTPRRRVRFRPSSVDWSGAKLFFPPQSTTRLPTGRPKDLPRVQSPSIPREETGETGETRRRRAAVRDAFVRSWSAYEGQAWTWDELRPVSGGGKNTFGGWAATLVDSLDTLWIMGCVYAILPRGHQSGDPLARSTCIADSRTPSY